MSMGAGKYFSVLRDYNFGVNGIMFVWVLERFSFLSFELSCKGEVCQIVLKWIGFFMLWLLERICVLS